METIDRYFIDFQGDIDYEEVLHKDGAYCLWEDVEPILKELEELRNFYKSIEDEVNWTYRSLRK